MYHDAAVIDGLLYVIGGYDAALGDMPKRMQAHSYDETNEGPAR